MIEKKLFITRIAITFNPPTFKFEYTKGRCREKYHKHVRLERYFDGLSSGAQNSMERSIDAMSIVTAITDRHDELRQVPEETMERVIGMLLSSYISNQCSNSDAVSGQSQPVECQHVDEPIAIACKSKSAHEIDGAHAAPSKATVGDETDRRTERYEDLNEATDEVLSLAKHGMNVTFEKYLILPGNDRFEYDKRIDFHPDEDSSWD